MANPNTVLADKILQKLKEASLLASDIDEDAFKTKLETGKMQSLDWDTIINSSPVNNEQSNEITETGN
jgi:undecaprenyl pyrophosphate synthase